VADIYLREQFKPLAPLPAEIKTDAATLDGLVGVYKVGPNLLDVRREGESLVVASQDEKKTLVPFGEAKSVTEFFERADRARYRFVKSNTQRESGCHQRGRPQGPDWVRLEFAELTAAKLADHAGMYWSKELETFGSIVLRDGKLILQLPRRRSHCGLWQTEIPG